MTHRPNSILLFLFLNIIIFSQITILEADTPDSAFIFAYATEKNNNHNGLHFAWSIDNQFWNPIGPEHRFLASDYGRWGKEKRMLSPFLIRGKNNIWHCVWSVNEEDGVLSYTHSEDLINWKPQSYPEIIKNNNCLDIEISPKDIGIYNVSWVSTLNKESKLYSVETKDFKLYSDPKIISKNEIENKRVELELSGEIVKGTIHKVEWIVIDNLINSAELAAYNSQLTNESFQDDYIRFKNLQNIEADITANLTDTKEISNMLMGIFFEDINYAADGGIYAELIENRGFEYQLKDKLGRDSSWVSTKAWYLTDSSNSSLKFDIVNPIHENNKNYAVLTTSEIGIGLANMGFAGINIKEGEKYNFSAFFKNYDEVNKKIEIRLVGPNGEAVASGFVTLVSSEWEKIETTLIAEKSIKNANLEILPQTDGTIALDMISLFPQNTFKGRKNGLRRDLAQTIADIYPRFIRFPGGCVAHGDGLDNIYRWKNTIGPLEARKPQPNIWRYHQSYGLGFFEYFQFCEDVGAEPIPVVAAGVPCQNSSTGGKGQQGGIPMAEMDQYVEDVLDLIEYCNGDVNSTWGKKRAEAGHPDPFNLKYIGIGNEDLISEIFKDRFKLIYDAVQEKHPEITVIGTVGPFNSGSDYTEGWKFADSLKLQMVDEHYYQQPGWFINNQDFYDKYDRSKSKVYLGEYASWGNTLYNALAEAIYLTAIERNADVVTLASYAPLLAKNNFTQWRTDLIFFSNSDINLTPNYMVQKLYGQNSGDKYINSKIVLSENRKSVRNRVGISIVTDSNTGDVIIKMANLLPVEVNSKINLDGLTGVNQTASKYLLTGNPQDKKAVPTKNEINLENLDNLTLPAYSFTLIRIHSNNNEN